MTIRGQYLVCLIMLLFFAAATQAYEVVLKNGKIVKGTLVSEDDALIVIQDADGLRINIKKANVDAEKTQTANPPATPAASAEQVKPAETAPTKAQKQPQSKPAKKITEEDLEKLREKYDLGEGTFSQEAQQGSEDGEDSAEPENDDFSQASESAWHAKSEQHRDRVKTAEERYTSLAQKCEELKKIAVQTHILVDQDGNEMQMTETREKVCEMADSARAQLEQARSNLNEFLSEAREKAVPPGWLRDRERKDPDQ